MTILGKFGEALSNTFKIGKTSGGGGNVKPEGEKPKAASAPVTASAAESMATQNMLLVQKSYTPPEEPVELNESEFQSYKRSLKPKIEAQPRRLQHRIQRGITKNNIFVADRLLTIPDFSKDTGIMEHFFGSDYADPRIKEIDTLDREKSAVAVLDKVSSDPKYTKDPEILYAATCYTLERDRTEEEFQRIFDVSDRMLDFPEALQNPDYRQTLTLGFVYGYKEEEAKQKCQLLDSMKNMPDPKVRENAGKILPHAAFSLRRDKLPIANKIFGDERLYGNEYILNAVLDTIDNDNKHEQYIRENHFTSVYYPLSEEAVQSKCAMLDKLVSAPEISQNPTIMEHTQSIMACANTMESVQGMSDMIDVLVYGEGLLSNENIAAHAGDIITSSTNKAKYKAVNSVLGDEEICSDPAKLKTALDGMSGVKTEAQADVFALALKNSHAAKNPKGIVDGIISEEHAKFARTILENDVTANSPQMIKTLPEILSKTETAQKAKEKTDRLNTFLGDENALKSDVVMQNLPYMFLD